MKRAVLGLLLVGGVMGFAAPTDAQTGTPRLEVRVERGTEAGPNEFYVRVNVTVGDLATGQPAAGLYDLFASATNDRGEVTEDFSLIELPTAGAHGGFVIVPHGGPWRITAVVNRRQDERNPRPPVTYATGTLDVDVAGGALASAATGIALDRRKAEPSDVAVLYAHTAFALGWSVVAGVLALLAVPGGRRFLSVPGANALDQRLHLIVRASWWLTGLVVLTGVYNLANSVPYRVPLSPDDARRVFSLPYAKPYFLALSVKLATYAGMIGATIPLMLGARRQATRWPGRPVPSAAASGAPAFDPWEDREPALIGAALSPAYPRSVATPTDIPGSRLEGEPVGDRMASEPPAGTGLPIPVAVIGLGGALLIFAVTVLKYLHLLSEAVRGQS